MRIGIVSDIHGNIAALEAALSHLGPIDRLVCLGDSISQYAFSNPVVKTLKDLGAITLRGNHEEAFFNSYAQNTTPSNDNAPSLMEWLAARPFQTEFIASGRRIFLTHATPVISDWRYLLPHMPAFRELKSVNADFVLYGHTHVALAHRSSNAIVVNPGSAGESKLIDGRLCYSCALLDLEERIVQIIEFCDQQKTRVRTRETKC